MTKEAEYIVSTRLDTDDCLHLHFYEQLQRYCSYFDRKYLLNNKVAVNFPLGLQFNGEKSYIYLLNNNPFLSLIENKKEFMGNSKSQKTILQCDHGKIHSIAKVHNAITRIPMWIQQVHGDNVSNSFISYLPELANQEKILSKFAIKLSNRERTN